MLERLRPALMTTFSPSTLNEPVPANASLSVRNGQLTIMTTDLEVELVAATEVAVQTPGDITVPGRKFLGILRAWPEKVSVLAGG